MDTHVCVDNPTQKNGIYECIKLKMCFLACQDPYGLLLRIVYLDAK